MLDNLEYAREYRAFFTDKSYVIRVGRGDCPHPDNPEIEKIPGEQSMYYLAHTLIWLGIELADLEQLELTATDNGQQLQAEETIMLKIILQERLTKILKR